MKEGTQRLLRARRRLGGVARNRLMARMPRLGVTVRAQAGARFLGEAQVVRKQGRAQQLRPRVLAAALHKVQVPERGLIHSGLLS